MYALCLSYFIAAILYRLSFDKTAWCNPFICGAAAAVLVSALGMTETLTLAVFILVAFIRLAADYVASRIKTCGKAGEKGIVLSSVGDGIYLVLSGTSVMTVSGDYGKPFIAGDVVDIDKGEEID